MTQRKGGEHVAANRVRGHIRGGAGRLEELKTAMDGLVRFVEANEPQLLAYNVYFSEDGSRMTVLHVNPDAASLEFHMNVAGPKFPPIAEFITMLAIDVYGRPDDALVGRLREKAEMLGSGIVCVHDLHAGFARRPIGHGQGTSDSIEVRGPTE